MTTGTLSKDPAISYLGHGKKIAVETDHLVESCRLVACLIVLHCHFFSGFVPRSIFSIGPLVSGISNLPACVGLVRNPCFNFLVAGNFAVAFFFVLSGYILSRPTFNGTDMRWFSICGDILKRLPRLGIPLYFFTMISMVLALCGAYERNTWPTAFLTGSLWLQKCSPASNATWQDVFVICVDPFENAQKVLCPAWTIFTELIGSLLTYGLAAIMRSSSLSTVIGLTCFLLVPGFLKLFVFGVLWASWESKSANKIEWLKIRLNFWRLPLALAVFYCASFPWYFEGTVLKLQAPLYTPLVVISDKLQQFGLLGGVTALSAMLGFVGLKMFSNDSSWTRRFSPLGKHTYTIYLSHIIILAAIAAPVFSYCLQHLLLSFRLSLFVTYAVYFAGVTAAAVLFTHRVDGGAIKLGRYIKREYLRSVGVVND